MGIVALSSAPMTNSIPDKQGWVLIETEFASHELEETTQMMQFLRYERTLLIVGVANFKAVNKFNGVMNYQHNLQFSKKDTSWASLIAAA